MPIPKPRQGERRNKYISRCVGFVMGEGTTRDPAQAAAICNSTWRSSKKGEDEIEIESDSGSHDE